MCERERGRERERECEREGERERQDGEILKNRREWGVEKEEKMPYFCTSDIKKSFRH